jgi:hypothetical protein
MSAASERLAPQKRSGSRGNGSSKRCGPEKTLDPKELGELDAFLKDSNVLYPQKDGTYKTTADLSWWSTRVSHSPASRTAR